jgi:RHS repeat-associated protein
MRSTLLSSLVAIGLLAGALSARAAWGTNDLQDPFSVNDAKDHGCQKTAANVGGKCPECPEAKGMASFWVSQPYINLWVADEPVSYTTSLGEQVPFRLTYDQRDTRPTNGSVPGLTSPYIPSTGWNHNWFSYVHFAGTYYFYYQPPNFGGTIRAADFSTWTATLYAPGGGESYFSSSSAVEIGTGLRLMPMDGVNQHIYPKGRSGTHIIGGSELMYGLYGFRLIYPDGSQDLYGDVTTFYHIATTNEVAPVWADALLTEHLDPYGNSTHFYYREDFGGGGTNILLQYVVDYDGRTNTLSYSNNLLTRVDMPYGRSAQMSYDANGRLAGITDAATNTSSFGYDPATGWLTNLTTPYGTTTFAHTDLGDMRNGAYVGNAGGTNRISRAVKVTYPDQSKELYLYRYDSSQAGMPSQFPSGQIPTGTPLGSLDDGAGTNALGAAYLRNTYHWNPKQYAGLQTEQMTSFNASDYALATAQRWLADSDPGWLSGVVSWRREASPDGVQPGQLTWYDYPGKTNKWQVGTDTQVGVAAQVLPDGSTRYQWTQYNTNGLPATNTATYTPPGGGIGTRTFTLVYTNLTGSQVCYQQGYAFSTVTWPYPGLMKVLGPQQESLLSLSGFTNVQTSIVRSNYTMGEITFTTTLPSRLTLNLTNAVSEAATAWFNQRQQLTGVRLASGLTRTNTYGADGFLTGTRDLELNRSNSFVFTNGLLAIRTNVLGLGTTYTWDALERLTSASFPDTTTLSNVYNRLDLTAQKDRLNHWTWADYDSLDHLASITDARTNTTLLGWCDCGALTSITDPLTNTTSVAYNYQGLWTNIFFGDNSSLTCTRDALGRPTKVADGLGRWLSAGYNNQGLLTAVSNAYGRLWSVTYDVMDRPIRVTDADNVTLTNQFDGLGRLTARFGPDGIGEGLGWSTNGLVAYTNRNGKVTRFARDAAGRLTGVTNANLEVTSVAYNARNQVTDLWDGRTNHTAWHYDAYGRLTNKVDALGHEVFRYICDANGQVTNRWTPQFGDTDYIFDEAGNLKTISYSAGSSVSFDYDALNRLEGMADAVGTTTFGYTGTGRLQTEAGPWSNDTLTYGYTQGQRTSMSLDSLGFGYGYDSARRLYTLTSPAGQFWYGYGGPNASSDLVRTVSLPNSAWITNHYDSLERLDYTALVNRWGHVLDGYGYTHDLLGLRTNIVRDIGLTNSSVAVGYDSIGQITSWQAREGVSGPLRLNEQMALVYDQAGNLRYRTNGGLVQAFSCDGVNQLTNVSRNSTMTVSGATPAPASSVTVNGQSAQVYGDFTFARTDVTLTNGNNTFSIAAQSPNGTNATNNLTVNLPGSVTLLYDSNGNLTNDGTRSFAYGAENQLTNATVAGQWKTDFIYDGLGRRRIIREFTNSSGSWLLTCESRLVYDGWLVIQQLDTNNLPVVTYTRGLDLSGSLQGAGGIGGLLARTDTNGSPFYHADGAGNVTGLIDGSQTMAARYLYGAFGRLTGKWGPMADANVMQFSSMPVHRQSGLDLYPFRGYEPTLQRWLNQDPIGELGGMNLYRFVGNSPVNYVDPHGLSWLSDYLYQVGQGIYDLMMGDQSGQYNRYSKGALDAEMGLVDIDRNNNVLRDSMGGGLAILGEMGKETAKYYLGGKAAEVGLGIAGAAACKARPLLGAAKGTAAAEQGGLNLFKWKDATSTTATGWKEGDYFLNLPNQGSAQANWIQNSSRLRAEMGKGNPIFDSFRDVATGEQIPTRGFLNAERNLLENHGWNYIPQTGAYHPPGTP